MNNFVSIASTFNILGEMKIEISNIVQGDVFDSAAQSRSDQLAAKVNLLNSWTADYPAGESGNAHKQVMQNLTSMVQLWHYLQIMQKLRR